MHIIGFEEFKNTEIITKEGFIIGTTFDLRYNSDSWKIKGIRFSPSPSMKKIYPTILKRMMLVPSNKYIVEDVILTELCKDDLATKFVEDVPGLDTTSKLTGKAVVTSDGITLGTVDSVHIDVDDWYVKSLRVKLDKEAHKPLGIKKKIIFSKVVSGVLTSFIKSVDEKVVLRIPIKAVKSQVIIED